MTVARLHHAAMSSDPEFHLFTSKVDEAIWLRWMSGQFKETVDGGYDSLLVVEQTDTKELLGFALSKRRTRQNRPTLHNCQFPNGFNEKELIHISMSGVAFQEEFLSKYDDFICKSRSECLFTIAPLP